MSTIIDAVIAVCTSNLPALPISVPVAAIAIYVARQHDKARLKSRGEAS